MSTDTVQNSLVKFSQTFLSQSVTFRLSFTNTESSDTYIMTADTM